MVTRKGSNGIAYGPNQRVGVEEAIKVWTQDGAFTTFEEKTKGSITPGKLADFVVLHDKDWRELVYVLGANPVREVWVGGKRVVG